MSQDLGPLFSKGINEHFGLEYSLYPSFLSDIFHMDTMDGRYSDEQEWEGYQLPGARQPGEGVIQGSIKPSFGKRFTPVNYGLGDIITQEDWDDDQYGVLAKVLPQKGGALARSHSVLKEIVAANFFKNIAFAAAGNNTPFMADGRPLFDTAHPVSSANIATTYGNRPSTDADLSIATYQAAASNLRRQFATNNTEIINNSPRALVVNTDLHYVATQILKGDWERGTADRNLNVIKQDMVKLVEWPYLNVSGSTGTRNGWLLIGQTHGLQFLVRQETEIETDYIPGVRSHVFISSCRFVCGARSWRGVYGNKGQ